ncbi:type II toxin-antitoxin system RelE/ParE family toxin [Neochlamydia sp. S13]|uniref:type II toxin-antitoxin system RelE/ParE family toxin n=1 Tax=Neochlamydia sp. S13 TaxID=1353976 RepID=UPI000ADBD620|nr:type II toxin-antitoxin system RelE/ParE family toxin [Neochlamydia sp. S13]
MEFPDGVKNEMGHALCIAQKGEKHRGTKPFKRFRGGSVLEIVQSDARGTYRTGYMVQMEKAVIILHAFQKKSKTGIKTPKQEIDLVEQRLRTAPQKYKEWLDTLKFRG